MTMYMTHPSYISLFIFKSTTEHWKCNCMLFKLLFTLVELLGEQSLYFQRSNLWLNILFISIQRTLLRFCCLDVYHISIRNLISPAHVKLPTYDSCNLECNLEAFSHQVHHECSNLQWGFFMCSAFHSLSDANFALLDSANRTQLPLTSAWMWNLDVLYSGKLFLFTLTF